MARCSPASGGLKMGRSSALPGTYATGLNGRVAARMEYRWLKVNWFMVMFLSVVPVSHSPAQSQRRAGPLPRHRKKHVAAITIRGLDGLHIQLYPAADPVRRCLSRTAGARWRIGMA